MRLSCTVTEILSLKLAFSLCCRPSSLHMLRVALPVSRMSKMTTYLEFPRPYYLFTIQLLWAYDDDLWPFVGENFIQERFWRNF